MTINAGFTYEGAKKAAAVSGLEFEKFLELTPLTLDSCTTIKECEVLLHRIDCFSKDREPVLAKLDQLYCQKLQKETDIQEIIGIAHYSPRNSKAEKAAWSKVKDHCLKMIINAKSFQTCLSILSMIKSYSFDGKDEIWNAAETKLWQLADPLCLSKMRCATTIEEAHKILNEHPRSKQIWQELNSILDNLYLEKLNQAITLEDVHNIYPKFYRNNDVQTIAWDKMVRLALERLNQTKSEEEIRKIYGMFGNGEARKKAEAMLIELTINKLTKAPTIEDAKKIYQESLPPSREIREAYLARVYYLANTPAS